MGEKLKDLLYDLSDTLLTLLIIILIVGTVSWKISDSMTYSNALAKAQPPVIVAETSGTEVPLTQEPESPSQENQQAGAQSPASEVKPSVNTMPGTGAGNSTSGSVSQPVSPSSGQKITLEIRSGSTGYSIAKLLVEKGLVQDTQTFIQRVEALKLGSKLKAGTFEVTSGMPLDELIRVITGN